MNLGFLKTYNLLVGLCDASTGLLLMFAPAFTLNLMGVSDIPSDLVYLRFIGAFVFSVGAAYWLPFIHRANVIQFVDYTRVVWMVTALVRTAVCLLVSYQIFSGGLSLPWISVALTDGILALLQLRYIGSLRASDV